MSSSTTNQKWLKASVIGGLWAGIEIIAGSFLHNLKIPFSGTFLTLISIVLVIGVFQIWVQNGLIWRAAVITALMKSISPSTVILGPMIAIAFEGLVMEIALRIIGKNIFGYISAGMFAMIQVLIHKFVHLFLLYSWDIFLIYEELFRFSAEKIGLSDASPAVAVLLLFLIYITLGGLAALFGYFTGLKAVKEQSVSLPNLPETSGKNQWEQLPDALNYSSVLLISHLLLIPCILYLINKTKLICSFSLAFPYFLFIIRRYRFIIKRLKNLFFWFQFFIILVLAWFFGNPANAGIEGRLTGLYEGFSMILRALVVIMGFAAISTELRAPLMQRLFYRSGFRNLYLSINNAFSILPAIAETINSPRQFFRNPVKSVAFSLKYVTSWQLYLTDRLNTKS
ncbi:MAG: hypothetical protein EOM06_02175 [Sphingobacteriia bacterium]|nr:hypothetical protein [Sphingobacteriia bacterium]